MSNQTTDFEALGWAQDAKAYRESAPEKVITYLQEKCDEYGLSGDNRPSNLLTSALEQAIEANKKANKGKGLDESARQLALAMYELGAAAKDVENELSFPDELKRQFFEHKAKHEKSWGALIKSKAETHENIGITRAVACAHARSLWEADTKKEIRIGEMTDIVWKMLAEERDLVEFRPETIATLRNWLKDDVAGDFPHSQQRGRKPKA